MRNKNLAKVLFLYMKERSIEVTYSGVCDELSLYPSNGSISAISHLFNTWRVKNKISQVNPGELHNIVGSFITQFRDNSFVLVRRIDQSSVFLSNGEKHDYKLGINEFNDRYNGTIITGEKTLKSGEKDYAGKHRTELVNKVRIPFVICGSIVLLSLYMYNFGHIHFNLRFVFLLIFNLAGLFISVLLLQQHLGQNNVVIEKFCGVEADKNCNAILSSDAAMVTKELSWSEVGFFYFSGSLIVLLVSNDDGTMQVMSLINLLCLPYTVYSIYYQWMIAGQWCVFCCTILILLWLEFFTLFPHFFCFSIALLQYFTNVIIGFGVPILAWVVFKPYFSSSIRVQGLQQQLSEFKYNKSVFNGIMTQGNKYDLLNDEYALSFGRNDAKHTITMVSNPFCGHCAKMHRKLNNWLSSRRDIKLQVVFATSHNPKRIAVVNHLMALRSERGAVSAHKALNAWYGQSRKNYQLWKKKFPVKENIVNTKSVQMQQNWCIVAKVTSTPILFIDGFKTPNLYTMDDIRYLI